MKNILMITAATLMLAWSGQTVFAAVNNTAIGVQKPATIVRPGTAPTVTTPSETAPSGKITIDPAMKKSDEKKDIVAKVVWVKGVFTATTTDLKVRALKSGNVIYLHDTLRTESDAKAQIVFTDDALMTFVPNTEFTVNDYHFDPKGSGKDDSYIMGLVKGGFRTITGLVAKANPEGYKVITPVATIGVRGTDYAVFLKDGQLLVARYKGKPCVTPNTPDGNQSTLCLDEKGQFAKVENGVVVPLDARPPEFNEKGIIVNVGFGDSFDGMTMPGTVTPGSILSNFCIQ